MEQDETDTAERALTAQDVEDDLSSREVHVRQGWAERMDYRPTDEQIERGLQDHNIWSKIAFLKRDDLFLTPYQVDRALNDQEPAVRQAGAERRDLSLGQIAKGSMIRIGLSKRPSRRAAISYRRTSKSNGG